MLRNMTRRFCRTGLVALAVAFAFIAVGVQAQAQTTSKAGGLPPLSQPLFRDYRGITIGMTADQVHARLGTPQEASKGQEYYPRSESEFAQVIYDSAQRVKVVAVTYVGEAAAPTAQAVFDEEVAAAADGAIHKAVNYPAAGYSVSYYRTGGTDPLITVTIQKLRE
ncbi:MAG TPA: hypothetical protein VGC87_03010 [Pyrinomonadaceae bacterium]|jgi:hypothetical protein